MQIDPALPLILRRDADRLHRDLVRRDFAITADIIELYGLAGLTEGEQRTWAKFAALDQGKRRYSIMQGLLVRQPSLRLGLILDDLAEIMLAAGVADLRTRDGALVALRWVERGCRSGLLPPSITEEIGPKLVTLRNLRFGWIVPPQSGGIDRGAATTGAAVEFPRVWLSEAHLEKYYADAEWDRIFE